MFFQNTILKKHLATLHEQSVQLAWAVYKAYFLNKEIQQNIRQSKEEQFQEGFLRELFVKVLGYTLNPSPDYNLITEQKNETDSKKADGAILLNEVSSGGIPSFTKKVIGIIELKDHKTTDLKQVEQQAFGYKHQHPAARYVIISNFEKLRFYIDNAVECMEWNLFTLTEEQFRVLYFCLSYPTLSQFEPIKAKAESVSTEDQITARLYKDYSAFKRELFADIVANVSKRSDIVANASEISDDATLGNVAHYDRLTLFKKTQKLLDRLLFIFFAEDCGLLPPNSMIQIIDQWQQLRELDEYVPLYNRIKKYFGYMNTGYKGKHYEIFAYNGGLFKPDEVLNSLIISDEVLVRNCRRLSEYDYASEVDVNILGHIFENSLNEIEEFYSNADSAGNAAVPSRRESDAGEDTRTPSKRKRDGVFYTPQYITKYIVENTVGRLCEEKKATLGIAGETATSRAIARYGSTSDTPATPAEKRKALSQLEAYRQWLLDLKICDPACGSGAFLNAALQFLMAEHRLIDEMQAKITGDSIVFQNIENSILENNLYGVDINEESVEIAKLALWLRVAKPHRKLSSLNDNIKCGNSLISDPTIAGDKAFDWQKEFPQVFAQGGFDVVIGNPPYVRVQQLDYKIIDFLKTHYETAIKRVDMSLCFIEKSRELIKENGVTAFITSNQFLTTEYGQGMRKFLLSKYFIRECVDFGDLSIFEDALTYVSIFTLSKQLIPIFEYYKVNDMESASRGQYTNPTKIEINNLTEQNWNLAQYSNSLIYKKLSENTLQISDIGSAFYGIVTGADNIFIFEKEAYENSNIEKELFIPLLRAQSCSKYYCNLAEKYVLYPYKNVEGATVLLSEDEIKTMFPNGWNYLLQHKAELEKRKDSRSTFEGRNDWYCLTRFGLLSTFNKNKIVTPGEVKEHKFCIDYSKAGYSGARVFAITIEKEEYDIRYVLCLLNSVLIKSYIQSYASLKAGGYYSYSTNILNSIPIKTISLEQQQPFISLADEMLSLNEQLQQKRARFLRRLQDNLGCAAKGTHSSSSAAAATEDGRVPKITTALEQFDTLSFAEFIKELKKQKISLSLVEQDEWEDYFAQYKAVCESLRHDIAATDKEIDSLVYNLYELTDEERAVIEQG